MSRRFIAALSFVSITTSVQAQDECKLDEPGKWWAPAYFNMMDRNAITPAERAFIESTLKAAEAFAHNTSYEHPRGFALRAGYSYHGPSNRSQLSPYDVAIISYARCNHLDEHGADIQFLFNPDPGAWAGNGGVDAENGDKYYFERVGFEPLFGSTRTFGRVATVPYRQRQIPPSEASGLFVLFTRGNESPTIPVTREEFLRYLIFDIEEKNQQNLKDGAAFAEKTSYERWMEGAAERKKHNEEILAGVAAVDPSQVPKVRADLEKAERDGTETLKKQDAAEREQLSRIVPATKAFTDKLRAQIAAMSPQERALPAYVSGEDFVPADSYDAHAVVRPNPDFYRARGSIFEPRILLVFIPNPYQEYQEAHVRMYRELDWVAIKRMVNR